MTVLDSSVVIDYLAGRDPVVDFVDGEESLFTSTICVYEVLAGEVFSHGPTDIVGRRHDFGRVQVVDFTESVAIETVRLQATIQERGDPLSPRDAMVAATARSIDDGLVVSDADFDTMPLRDLVSVTTLSA